MLLGQMSPGQMSAGQMLHEQMLHGQLWLGINCNVLIGQIQYLENLVVKI